MNQITLVINGKTRTINVDPEFVGQDVVDNLSLNSPQMYLDIMEVLGRQAADKPWNWVNEIGRAVIRGDISWGVMEGTCDDCEQYVYFSDRTAEKSACTCTE